MSAAPSIRPVQPADAEQWTHLRLLLWPDSTAVEEAEQIARFFADGVLTDLHAAFVADDGDRLGGLVEISIKTSAPGCETDHIGYLEAWYVAPSWRGQGIGRALVERAEQWAREAGCREMASDTNPSYPLSPPAHIALGYVEVARYFRKEL